MAINKAWCTGVNALMEWFDDHAEQPYYSVWRGRNLSFSWNNDDMEAGRLKLLNDITFAEHNNVSEVLTLKLHNKKDKSGYITSSTPTYGSLDFRPSPMEQQVYGVSVPHANNSYAMEKILDKLNILESKIAGYESMEDDFEEEEKPLSPINAMLNNPEIHQALVSGVMGMLGNLLGNSGTVKSLAGADDQNEAIDLLNVLLNKGVTVDHLRKLSEMSEPKLKSLLLML